MQVQHSKHTPEEKRERNQQSKSGLEFSSIDTAQG